MTRATIFVAAVMLGAGAVAQTPAVNTARQSGAVGERYDGFLGYASAPSGVLRSQVDAINIRRRSLYTKLAASRGVSPQEVGITAGCQLLGRVGVGEAYFLSDGRWRKRLAGQGSVAPDYCG